MLPSLFIATESKETIDISLAENKTKFILSGNSANLPYDLETGIAFHNEAEILTFEDFKKNPNNTFTQNTNFRSCEEIEKAGKAIGDGNYEILDNKGNLISTYCSFSGTTTKTEKCEPLENPSKEKRNYKDTFLQTKISENRTPASKAPTYNPSP